MLTLFNRLSWKFTHRTVETVRVLFVLAMVCVLIRWGIDYFSGIIVPFDQMAYPVCIGCFVIGYGLSYTAVLTTERLYFFVYIIFAGYLISTSLYHHLAGQSHVSNAAQWLGLNYVMAYLFLDVRRAGPTTLLVLIFTLAGHFGVLIQRLPLRDTLGVVLNIGIAHLVYIVLLWTIVKMRIAHDEVQTRVRILDKRAHIDPLTRLLNRRGITRALRQFETDYQTLEQRYAVCIIDIDHFKLINDRHGHLMGDHVLAELAHLMVSLMGEHDVVGRWGGEEFVVVSHYTCLNKLVHYADHLRKAIELHPFPLETAITVSIGISHCQEANNIQHMFDIADRHLYTVKQHGRNQVMASLVSV